MWSSFTQMRIFTLNTINTRSDAVDLSTIILRLQDMGAKVIGVDMLLDFKSAYGEDPTLADALADAGNILLVSQAQIEGDEYRGG